MRCFSELLVSEPHDIVSIVSESSHLRLALKVFSLILFWAGLEMFIRTMGSGLCQIDVFQVFLTFAYSVTCIVLLSLMFGSRQSPKPL